VSGIRFGDLRLGLIFVTENRDRVKVWVGYDLEW